jgi:hypothetical protein
VQLISVPSEAIEAPLSSPLLIFSIGRCGSTLLSALLNAAGRPSVSEPDFLCQLDFIAADKIQHVGNELIDATIRVGVDRLIAILGSSVAIKFRSQYNRAVLHYRRALPEAKIAFIFREPCSWSASVLRTFAEPAAIMVRRLKEAVLVYDQLVQSGGSPVLIWYEELHSDSHAVVARLLGCSISAELIWKAKAADSQANMAVAREAAKAVAGEQTEEFFRLWREAAPVDIIKRYSLVKLLC